MTTVQMIVEKHGVNTNDEPPYLISRTRWRYLPSLFRDLGFRVGVEIGVEEGRFSKTLCQVVPGLQLYAVDPWESYGWFKSTKYTQELMDTKYARAVERLAPFNCQVIREYSHLAVEQFEDSSLDFVFIDGNHEFSYAYMDIDLWTPKVRPGGLVTGHDYYNSRDLGRCRVKDAVDVWTRQHQIAVWFVIVGSRYPSWFWVRE